MISYHDGTKLLDSRPLACFFFQTAFGTAFTYLTSGVFLSGLAILMGAGDVLVSYLSVIVNICGVLILLFSTFMERFTSRKKLTLVLTAGSRLATLFIVLIPALVPAGLQLAALIPAVITAFTLQAQTTVVLNQWMLGFVDEKKSGRYISLRQTMTLFVTVVLSLSGGRLLDSMEGNYIGFVILFAFAGMMGIVEMLLLARTPDSPVRHTPNRHTPDCHTPDCHTPDCHTPDCHTPDCHTPDCHTPDRHTPDCHTPDRRFRFRDIAGLPLHNRPFAGFVLYILVFYLLLYISDSFTMVYLMKYLALPYQTVNLLYMIISLPQIVLLGIWGKISDKKGHKFVLTTSIWLFAGETLFMSFASPETWFLFIPAAFLISSAANAGFVIAVFNHRYELMPADNRIVYDNFYTAAIGIGFILGPMIGGAVKHVLETDVFLTNVIPFAGIRLLYPISTAGILLLQIIYLMLQRKRKESIYDQSIYNESIYDQSIYDQSTDDSH